MITYICAFYYIPENKKNNLEHYRTHIPNTFSQLKDQYVIFFMKTILF